MSKRLEHKDVAVWFCKMVIPADEETPDAFDRPPRQAVRRVIDDYGLTDIACFSGWGGTLTEGELACINNEMPPPQPPELTPELAALIEGVVGAVDALDAAEAEAKRIINTDFDDPTYPDDASLRIAQVGVTAKAENIAARALAEHWKGVRG